MSKYRINVRFDTDDDKQAEAVGFLQSLQKSRNAFIVSAVLDNVSFPPWWGRQDTKTADTSDDAPAVIP